MSLSKINPQGHEIVVNGSNILYSSIVRDLCQVAAMQESFISLSTSGSSSFYKSSFYFLLLLIIDYADVACMGLISKQLSKLGKLHQTRL